MSSTKKSLYRITLTRKAVGILPAYTRFEPMAFEQTPSPGSYFAGFEPCEDAADDRLMVLSVSVSPALVTIGLESELNQ